MNFSRPLPTSRATFFLEKNGPRDPGRRTRKKQYPGTFGGWGHAAKTPRSHQRWSIGEVRSLARGNREFLTVRCFEPGKLRVYRRFREPARGSIKLWKSGMIMGGKTKRGSKKKFDRSAWHRGVAYDSYFSRFSPNRDRLSPLRPWFPRNKFWRVSGRYFTRRPAKDCYTCIIF